jgi:hypothetical protein
MEIPGTLGDNFGCLDLTNANYSWRAKATGSTSDHNGGPLTLVSSEEGYWRLFCTRFGDGSIQTQCSVRQGLYLMSNESAFLSVWNLVSGMPVEV